MSNNGRYAKETTVTVEKSRAEVEGILERYGADQFFYARDTQYSVIGFRIAFRHVKIGLPMPDPADFAVSDGGRERNAQAQKVAHDQACRQRWRALALVIKAKLEAIECGISTVEREFLADVMLPNGRTVGQSTLPMITAAYESGQMPRLLPMLCGVTEESE